MVVVSRVAFHWARKLLYLENVYAILSKQENMQDVMRYLVQDRPDLILESYNAHRLKVLWECALLCRQECARRDLIVYWSAVALENVGLPAATLECVRYGQGAFQFSGQTVTH